MSLPAQHHLGRLVGQDGRPVYMAVCSPTAGQYDLMRLIGQREGRPVYAKVDCSWLISGSPAALPQGYYRMRLVGQNGRPVYVGVCCSTEAALGSSGSLAASSGSIALPSGSLAESVSQGSLVLGSSGSLPASESASVSASASASESGSLSQAGSSGSVEAGSGSGSLSGVGRVTIPCCPDPISTILYATKTNVLSCICLNDVSMPLFWDGDRKWIGSSPDADCGCGSVTLILECVGSTEFGTFTLTIICGAYTVVAGPIAAQPTCNPLFLVAEFLAGTMEDICGSPTDSATFTITG